MRVVFRADASVQIGTGHVMRCLTLADALSARGADCAFLCREYPGNLIEFIRDKGYHVHVLPMVHSISNQVGGTLHAHWLGCTQEQDAAACANWLQVTQPEWLVVDHYALDARWEINLRSFVGRLLVIDDCADRPHVSDVLLDQNMVANMHERYINKVPKNCKCLLGPRYAILRAEFGALRAISLERRQKLELKRLLVFMGGSDASNDTGKVVAGIKLSKRSWEHLDIIVGQSFPAIKMLRKSVESLAFATLHIQTPRMAQLMAAADLAITSGGSITWEKCSLGLPSLVVMQSPNQYSIGTVMHEHGAQQTLGYAENLTPSAYATYLDAVNPNALASMSRICSSICVGNGVELVVKTMGIQE